jgi:hypothetical protein
MTSSDHHDIPFTYPMECLSVNGLPDGHELKVSGARKCLLSPA